MTSLPPGFELKEHTGPEVASDVFNVMLDASKEDRAQQAGFGTCTREEIHEYCVNLFGPLFQTPAIKTYQIVEKSSGKMVAFTSLQFPLTKEIKEQIPEELLTKLTSHDPPPLHEKMNKDAMMSMLSILGWSNEWGYNMETDFHRKGTNVLPDYQKKGFGTVLTRHCNAIADAAGQRTWVPARYTSVKLFRNEGFKDHALKDLALEQWIPDARREESLHYLLLRNPPKKA